MTLLSTFFYYVCFSSVILIYGIGINKTIELDLSKAKNFIYIAKIIFSIVLTSTLSWLITIGILVPLKIVEIYPLICFLVFVCVNVFLEALIRLTTGNSTSEFIFSYLVILISVGESTSILNTLIICFSCLVAFALIIPFVYSFKIRNNNTDLEKYFCKFFLYIALLIFAITVWDVMWFNPEVIQ